MEDCRSVCFGGDEFGEAYHAAAFLAICDKHRVTILGQDNEFRSTCNFLNRISKDSTSIAAKRTSERGIGFTADVFCERQHENLPALVASRLVTILNSLPQRILDHAEKFVTQQPSCLLWVRHEKYKSERNLTELAYRQLDCVLQEAGISPILIGSKLPFLNTESPNLLDFFKDRQFPEFERNPLVQLQFLNHICTRSMIKFSIGMKSGGMDGMAFCRRLRTYYISHPDRNWRMAKVSKAFPTFSLVPVNYDNKFLQFSRRELEYIYTQVSQ